MNKLETFFFILLLFLAVGCSENKIEDGCKYASKIIDGDTFVISTGEHVRLIGINAPEKGKQYSKLAAEELTNLVSSKCLIFEKDISDKDAYGRLLRYVYADNESINEILIRKGLAKQFPYKPDIKYADKFNESEAYAKTNNLGMWAR
ncbi:thermonuclease family protein [Candidatus Woesearchaeota archaeon]|nr:thermonuclease family protein [Candidatus Woesearchaeota archaeon]